MSPLEQSEHVDEKDLELYLKAELSNELVLAIDAHFETCPDCVSRLVEQDKCLWYMSELMADEEAGEEERRRSPRVVTNEGATFKLLNPFLAGSWEVRIVDVSKGGLRISTPKGLTAGSLIRLKMQFSVACGDVRYCIPADDGFYAGIRLHDYFSAPGNRSAGANY